GHFVSTLRSARGFDAFLSGPLAAAGEQMHRFFASSQNIQLFPVTSLEEMAMAETLELAETMTREFGVACSALLVNCASRMCMAWEDTVASVAEPAGSSPALRFAMQRGLLERERCLDLRSALPIPQVLIPRMTQWSNDLDLLASIGDT